jgi:hypothetical protein
MKNLSISTNYREKKIKIYLGVLAILKKNKETLHKAKLHNFMKDLNIKIVHYLINQIK